MAGLVIKKLTKSFDGTTVLDNISLTVPPGNLLVVLGPSGCGKSTLLRLIAGLERADRGQIILDGVDITNDEPRKRKTGMVFQNYALYPHMTVFDNIAFPLRVAKVSKKQIQEAVRKTAVLLELDSLLDRRPAQLSGGQRQRVALGRGLIREPSIFLLDEPLSNLDAALRVKMRREIVSLQKRLGITMIYVTHDQTEALTMADQLIVLKDGIVQQSGTPVELYKHPANSFVASFIGTPPINLFEEHIQNGVGRILPIPYTDGIADGTYRVGIRPEHITICAEGSISGKIESLEYIGAVSYVRIATNHIRLTVTVTNNQPAFKIGDEINLSIDMSDVLLFQN